MKIHSLLGSFHHRIDHYLFNVFPVILFLLTACAHFRPPAPVKEARAIWLTRFEYCNYTTTHDQDSIRQYIADIIDRAAQANFNLVFFQVRGNGDAYYTPGLEPWGQLLTGTPGEDPGWDPLQFALERAHERGLELHAWINTFPAWRGTEPPPETEPRSPYLEHPEWVVCDSTGKPMPLSEHYVSFSPGIPEVHDYIIAVVTDIVRRYEVDGIHFDYIRYPEIAPDNGYSHDSVSVARFNSPEGNPFHLDWEDWQREQLNQFVYKAYRAITELKPWVKVSAAVIGSYVEGNWNAYRAVYQDPRRWMELGKIDFVTPMMYWPRRDANHPFLKRAEEWQQYYSPERYVFPGIGSYRYTTKKRNYNWREIQREIDGLRVRRIPGMAFFNAGSLQGRWDDLARGRFRTPANLPAMPWKDPQPPPAPRQLAVQRQGDSVLLTWSVPDSTDVRRYNIYLSRKLPINPRDSRNLVAVTSDSLPRWTFTDGRKVRGSYVAVSALDAAWNESPLSPPVRLPF
jgi:uncharacterized lipoprotein YddW (UPF0748 family)